MRWFLAFLALVGAAQTQAQAQAQAQDARRDYAAQCAAAIGTIPDFSCADGVAVPVTVGGSVPATYLPDMLCDRPSLLDNGTGSDGQCVPYSRILNLSHGTTQIAVMCRQKKIRSADSMDFDEIDVIAHSPASGATCWFQASAGDAPLDGSAVASPQSPAAGDFWQEPKAVAADGCGNCHDNDPFMYSPFVAQVWEDVPTDPFGPYFHVAPQYGFAAWPTDVLQPRDSTCLGCHRIGTEQTCGDLTLKATGAIIPEGSDPAAASYPANHFMPPDHGLNPVAWLEIHQRSVDILLECCASGGQDACNRKPINGLAE